MINCEITRKDLSVSRWGQELPPVDSCGSGLFCPDGSGRRLAGGALQYY